MSNMVVYRQEVISAATTKRGILTVGKCSGVQSSLLSEYADKNFQNKDLFPF